VIDEEGSLPILNSTNRKPQLFAVGYPWYTRFYWWMDFIYWAMVIWLL